MIRWDWENDGVWDTSYSSDKTALHTYTGSGSYEVTLEVRDTENATDTYMKTITVSSPEAVPVDYTIEIMYMDRDGVEVPMTNLEDQDLIIKDASKLNIEITPSQTMDDIWVEATFKNFWIWEKDQGFGPIFMYANGEFDEAHHQGDVFIVDLNDYDGDGVWQGSLELDEDDNVRYIMPGITATYTLKGTPASELHTFESKEFEHNLHTHFYGMKQDIYYRHIFSYGESSKFQNFMTGIKMWVYGWNCPVEPAVTIDNKKVGIVNGTVVEESSNGYVFTAGPNGDTIYILTDVIADQVNVIGVGDGTYNMTICEVSGDSERTVRFTNVPIKINEADYIKIGEDFTELSIISSENKSMDIVVTENNKGVEVVNTSTSITTNPDQETMFTPKWAEPTSSSDLLMGNIWLFTLIGVIAAVLILGYMLGKRKQITDKTDLEEEQEPVQDGPQKMPKKTPEPEIQEQTPPLDMDNLHSKLSTLKKLLKDDLITKEEFEEKKKELLRGI